MSDYEEKIRTLFNDNPQIPKEYRMSVDETLKQIINENNYNYEKSNINLHSKRNLTKLVAGLILGVISISGTVFASFKIYNNIWKNPEQFNYANEQTINEIEKNNAISEENAKSIAMNWFEKLGYANTIIEKCTLEKDSYYDKMYWKIDSNSNYGLMLNAFDGSFYQFGYGKKYPTNYKCDKEQAIKFAKEIYLKLGFKENEYELVDIQGANIESEGESFYWSVNFYKVYDGIYNEYQRVSLTFIPKINQIVDLTIVNNNYEDNPIILSKDEAINIAKEMDYKLHTLNKIKEVHAELKIENMNEYIYLKENNFSTTNQNVELNGSNLYINKYKNSNVYRKVWSIYISYEDNENKDIYTEYYVDVTTGEIIGGKGANLNENQK